MKQITLFILTLMMGLLGLVQEVNGQTKVFDQTVTWTHPPYQNGGYGFYWWHRTDGYSIINYGNMPSSNWRSPTDYYNGNFTMSVEVISQPTNQPFWIQFGIWGDKHKGGSHTETVAARKWVTGGAGAKGSYSLGSPSTWWNKQSGDHLDFSRANDFYRIGVVLWDGASTCIPMGKEWSAAGCPENAYKYFPMTIKISVYASGGSGPPPPPPPPPPTVTAPNYSIDYNYERTNKVVSTEDQYSYNSDFSDIVDGNGQYLKLTAGKNVYFRKKADNSKKQTLTVPNRPSAPSFGIDFLNQRTSSTVSSEFIYSANSDMSSSSSGSGSHVSLTPGSSIYFRKKATGSAFASNKQTLAVPGRPAAPSFGIDFANERTSATVSSEFIYSANSDLSSSSSGNGSHVSLTPGSSMYFRKKATGSAFASNKQTLAVPDRPAAPSFGIDYINERTDLVISSEYQHSASSDMSAASPGDGSHVNLAPGSTMYFRKLATASAFASAWQELIVPDRPDAPSLGIDYAGETTDMAITSELQYSSSTDFATAENGSGSSLDLSPGADLYFRFGATASSFSSEVFQLFVPERPLVSSVESGSTSLYPFIVDITFFQELASLDDASLIVLNAEIDNLNIKSSGSNETVFEGQVFATANDLVSISVPANVSPEGNFVSSAFMVSFTGQLPGVGIETGDFSSLTVFPNPGKGVFYLKLENFNPQATYRIEVSSINGKLVHTETFYGIEEDMRLDLSDLSEGLYLLRLSENEQVRGVAKLNIK